MFRKRLILADSDELYLRSFSNYLSSKAPQLDLFVFTSREKLSAYLENSGPADIVAVGESFVDDKIVEKLGKATKIILSVTMQPIEGFRLVKKYQKTEMILNEILLYHAEVTGSLDPLKGQNRTKTVAFYSPSGGCGKTILSLAFASACAAAGHRTLYLNLESVESVATMTEKNGGCLSELFLALKTKGMNASVKFATCIHQEPLSGFYYVSGPESVSEYEEVNGEDIEDLLKAAQELAEYEIVVVDTESGMSGRIKKVLSFADAVYIPIVSNETQCDKLKRFLAEEQIQDGYYSIFQKTKLIVNMTGRSDIGPDLRASGILEKLPCAETIATSPVLMSKKEVLRSGRNLMELFRPILDQLNL